MKKKSRKSEPGKRPRPESKPSPPVPTAREPAARERFQLFQGIASTLTLALVVAAPLVAEGTPEQFPNWLLVLLWMLLAAGSAGYRLLVGQSAIRLEWTDLALIACCGWMVISGLVSLLNETGHARATINATWQWAAYPIAYLVIRQWLDRAEVRTVAVVALFSLAAGCSLAGIYQRYVITPQLWETYQSQTEEEKRELLRQGGLTQVEPGSRERILYENRLYATSPTSTFVLANSLAVFLTPWLVVGTGMLARAFFAGRWSLAGWIAAGLTVMILALLLTKSRTSYLAALVGVVGMMVGGSVLGRRAIPWKFVIGLVALILVLVVATVLTGAVDVQVISEAGKSLSYRLEYWQASWELIRSEWLFGCGPGNFQHAYGKYQLVEASETVSDPHNFLIEIWAVGGTPALVFLLAGCLLWGRSQIQAWGVTRKEESRNRTDANDQRRGISHQTDVESDLWPTFLGLALGTLLGIFLATVNAANLELVLISGGAGIVIGLLFSLSGRIAADWFSLAMALVSLAIGLSASGGIGFPSVAIPGLLLIGLTARPGRLAADADQGDRDDQMTMEIRISSRAGQGIQVGVILLMLGAAFVFRATVIDPIRSAARQAEIAELEAVNGNLSGALRRLDQAIAADPYDGNYLFFRLQILFNQYKLQPTPERLAAMEVAARQAASARPRNSRVALETAKVFLSLLVDGPDLDPASRIRIGELAVEFLAASTQRRPQDALHAAYRAFGYDLIGDRENAEQWSAWALSLDERNPHPDKALRNQPFRVVGYESAADIEQMLMKIRKN